MKKIAILGGGVGAMSAAFELTNRPDWRQDYEVTVYQLGWRLGGKGASGRNAQYGQRIQEHGLHVWMGFYDNAFRTMQRCYEELGRPPSAPLSTWEDAFKPSSRVVLNEFVDGQWVEWPLTMPVNSGVPGEGGKLPTPWEFVEMILQWVVEAVVGPNHEAGIEAILERLKGGGELPDEIAAGAEAVGQIDDSHPERARLRAWLAEHLFNAREFVHGAIGGEKPKSGSAHSELLGWLDKFLDRLKKAVEGWMEAHVDVRRLFILADFGIAAVRGMLADGVLENGFTAADRWEYREWLKRHGAADVTVSSAPVREIYDLCFAYEDGALDKPNLAAGTALEIALRIAFTYKGAVMWKMQGGMGDVVFGPLYQVLRKRGVRFEFFHRVQRLEVSEDGVHIEAIRMERQVDLAEGVETYEPLVDVKGLPCWPAEPLYEQIAQGKELKRLGINLESRWSGWKSVGERRLARGTDFDDVVLGISLGALREICAELIESEGRWRTMVERVGTVQTQAVQLWLDQSIDELGRRDEGVVAGTYAEPLDTWADMSELLPREDWGPDDPPKTILYLCGPKRGGDGPPPDDTGYPETQRKRFRLLAETWLSSNTARILPTGGSMGNPAGLDWQHLHVVEPATGRARLAQQYFRVNIDPSEHYVLSLAGSTEARLPADDPHFENLYLAGDWVRTGLNAGCVEAAVMAGLAAAAALMRRPVGITAWPELKNEVTPTNDSGDQDG